MSVPASPSFTVFARAVCGSEKIVSNSAEAIGGDDDHSCLLGSPSEEQ